MGKIVSMTTTVLVGIFAVGCEGSTGVRVTGDGVVAMDSRALSGFDSIDVNDIIQATIANGPWSPLVLSGDENLLPLVETVVSEGRLMVQIKEGYSIEPTLPLRVTLTLPALTRACASGAATIRADVAPSDRFSACSSGAASVDVRGVSASSSVVDASGSSIVSLAGRSDSTKITTSGDAQALTQMIEASDVTVIASGASQVEVQANHSITGSLSGGSVLQVWGQPQTRHVDTSGAASVHFQ